MDVFYWETFTATEDDWMNSMTPIARKLNIIQKNAVEFVPRTIRSCDFEVMIEPFNRFLLVEMKWSEQEMSNALEEAWSLTNVQSTKLNKVRINLLEDAHQ